MVSQQTGLSRSLELWRVDDVIDEKGPGNTNKSPSA